MIRLDIATNIARFASDGWGLDKNRRATAAAIASPDK